MLDGYKEASHDRLTGLSNRNDVVVAQDGRDGVGLNGRRQAVAHLAHDVVENDRMKTGVLELLTGQRRPCT